MPDYVCLLFNIDDALLTRAEIISAGSKDEARAKAADRLRASTNVSGYDLWLNGEKVYSYFPSGLLEPIED